MAAPPQALAGYLEVRGVGIVAVECVRESSLGVVVDLTDRAAIARMPEPQTVELVGTALPLIRLDPFEVSADAKLRLVVRALRRGLVQD